MTLVKRLADEVLAKHPNRAASVLERAAVGDTVAVLARRPPQLAAEIVRRLSPQRAAAVLADLEPRAAGGILDVLALDTAARLVRRLEPAARQTILEQTDPKRARSLRAVLEFPTGSAGALMDPDVLALPQDLTAREALRRVRSEAEQARYNLYVVDPSQRLVGALTLRELLIARPRSSLSVLMTRDPHHLLASDDRATLLAHPGWKEVHSLPVVDREGAYVGAIRYRTLREIEGGLLAARAADEDASAAFGQLIAAGAGGLVDALAGATRRKEGDEDDG